MKTLPSTPEALIRQQFGSFATLAAIGLEINSADDAASPHSKLIGHCQSSGCGVSIVATRIAKNSPADLCAITSPHHRPMIRRT